MSQLQILIVSDTYCLSHIFLKAGASARSFLKWFCLKLQRVKHVIMFATFHGRHTHLWESPHGFESETIKWSFESESLEGGNIFSPFPPPLRILLYFLRRSSFLSTPDWECLLSLLVKSMIIHEQVLSQVLKDSQMLKILFCSSFYQKKKKKNHWLAEIILALCHERVLVSDSYQVDINQPVG